MKVLKRGRVLTAPILLALLPTWAGADERSIDKQVVVAAPIERV